MSLNGHGQIPLKVPKVEFNFDVSVDGIQMLTDTFFLKTFISQKSLAT